MAVAPHFYKVVLENDRVRVLEFRGKLGDKTEMHSHPPLVALALTHGQFRFLSPDGQSMDIGLKAGETMYLDAVDHGTEVLGTSEVHGILVELK